MATRPRRWRVDGRLIDPIRDRAARAWSAAEIVRDLKRSYPGIPIPDPRTIQRYVKALDQQDDAVPWSTEVADSDDTATLVLAVLGEIIRRTQGRRRRVTVSEARWIARIRRVDLAEGGNHLSHWDTYLLARSAAAGDVTTVDEYLAFAPWRDKEHQQRYEDAFDSGWIGVALTFGQETVDKRAFARLAGTITLEKEEEKR